MVREGSAARQQLARNRRGQFLALTILGFLVVTCILSLGRKAGQQHDAGTARILNSNRGTSAEDSPERESTFLPSIFAATRSTLDAAWGTSGKPPVAQAPVTVKHGSTLVIYLYSGEDHIHRSNFRYFIRWGLTDTPSLEFLFVVRNKVLSTLLDLHFAALLAVVKTPDCGLPPARCGSAACCWLQLPLLALRIYCRSLQSVSKHVSTMLWNDACILYARHGHRL